MKRQNRLGFAALTLAAASLAGNGAMAQDDPTAVGGGKKPYVLVVIDSSASMEWTDDGDNVYPFYDREDNGTFADLTAKPRGDGSPDDTPILGGVDSWTPGVGMEIDPSAQTAGPAAFGSCFVWEPYQCDKYHRPSWRPPNSAYDLAENPDVWYGWDPGDDPVMSTRLALMRGAVGGTPFRLQEESQPRHVTLKEILTGDMIMLPTGATSVDSSAYNPNDLGPGCWFVPRQRGASAQPDEDQVYCDGENRFEELVDHATPIPHFQEVYDLQVSNGVMDRLASTALFAVAAFDGYRDDQDSNNPPEEVQWDPNKLNDDIGSNNEYPAGPRRSSVCQEDANNCDCDGDLTNNGECYNLGLWRIVTPNDLQIPSTFLPELASYTQIAINDTGYLREAERDDAHTLDPDSKKSRDNAFLGSQFPEGFKDYIDKFKLGRQPIARATPLAGAMHDAHQFFAQVQKNNHFFAEDTFAACRPKHVIVLTDGKPEPELGDASTLNEAFGYETSRYPYDTTEKEILELVDSADVEPPGAAWDADDRVQFAPRVHVVGLNMGTHAGGIPDDDAIEKMALMAMNGNSCAQHLLPNRIPTTDGGPCEPGSGCLIDQSAYVGGHTYEYWDPDQEPARSVSVACDKYPALILDNNAPSVLGAALFEMFSSVIALSGLSSRTRLVVSNRLDDESVRGQYRIYSGTKIGGNSWWRGIVNRTTLDCDGSANVEVPLDEEVGRQVDLTTARQDSRRIFTSMPGTGQTGTDTKDIYSYSGGGVPQESGWADNTTRYFFSYDLSRIGSGPFDDEFQGTYLGGADETFLHGTRVPFERDWIQPIVEVNGNLDIEDVFNATGEADVDNIISTFRGRITERVPGQGATDSFGDPFDLGGSALESRAIGGILNSNPTVVTPPNLDLPIGSYRDFRALYADRPTMLYFASMDGLIHALHLGTLANRVNVRQMTAENTAPTLDNTNPGSAEQQREAWAYVPQMLWRDFGNNKESQPYLMDGTPVVKDVRLCNDDPTQNQNVQACKLICDGTTDCTIPNDQQWRTVMVVGRGDAGDGYVGMDVTRPGGLFPGEAGGDALQNPDPIVLWEFDREWERIQVNWLYENYPDRVSGPTPTEDSYWKNDACNDPNNGNDSDSARVETFYSSPLMGRSISQVEIATVIIDGEQRPVAVFGGGASLSGLTECGAAAAGMALYIVDLQTGSLIRRFTHFVDGANPVYFGDLAEPARFVGSPSLYDSRTGSIASRGFIGDSQGRLWRINLLDPDPEDWEVSLFFDPSDDSTTQGNQLKTLFSNAGFGGGDEWGPAAFRPVTALNPNRDVMVVYGLGEVGDVVSNGQAQAVLTLTEDRANTSTGVLNWAEVFPEGEKVTGEPIVFDRRVYFPTYSLPEDEACEPGTAKIWGLNLYDSDDTSLAPEPAITEQTITGISFGGCNASNLCEWYGPQEPTLIRGLTITLGPACSIEFPNPDSPTFAASDPPQPQLVAQTASGVDNALVNRDAGTQEAENVVNRMILDIQAPESQGVPLSWTVLD